MCNTKKCVVIATVLYTNKLPIMFLTKATKYTVITKTFYCNTASYTFLRS